MELLVQPLNGLESFHTLVESVQKAKTPVLATGVIDSQKCHLAYGIQKTLNRSALIITHSELHAKEIAEDMRFFCHGQAPVFHYPAKDMVFFHADVHSFNLTKQRLEALDALVAGKQSVIVLSVEALFDRLAPKAVFASSILDIEVGQTLPLIELSAKLLQCGYERTEQVEAPGQFAVRGGIVDIYTPLHDHALRLEYWGDDIDSIRVVDAQSQRSVDKLDNIRVLPMREMVYTPEAQDKAIAAIEDELTKTHKKLLKKGLTEEAQHLQETVGEALERMKETAAYAGVDQFGSYFYEVNTSLFDYLPQGTLVFFDEPRRMAQHAETVMTEFNDSLQNRILKGYLLPGQAKMIYGFGDVLFFASRFPVLLFSLMAQTMKDFTIKATASFAVKATAVLKQKLELLMEDLRYYCQNHYSVLLLTASRTRGRRLTEEMLDGGFSAYYTENSWEVKLSPGKIAVTCGSLHKGFEYQHINLVVITDHDLFGEEKKKKRRIKKKTGAKIESFTDLKIGDYVVHDNHGIGIYRGIEQIVSEGMCKDYIKLSYADGGNLYVHTSQMDMVQKYIGGEGTKLKLNKLGGADWTKAKAKAKKAVEVLAQDLIDLYAKRQAAVGYAYSPDNVWQREFEEMFPFDETDDQLTAITEVKKDMESQRVMDRLICGDVGYGKTEVALRAAFKAVQDGKQVAYLVPTTILAQQHYNTFVQRMKDFPIGIALMSRFRTKKQQEESVDNLERGVVDIIIGTHRLLSKDVKFKDLGLIIIDEEQRFGVAHKEKLKRIKENVDVMTLTATPIPRTLHMSLTGIRDMSLLEEPPQERQPVQTYVMEYNPEFVKDAINRELAREGQVFYLHNRVRNISEVAARVQALVPHANVAYAHGQMSEHELENIMIDFVNGDIQVLVCTTIIETGLDIPNANTIIIQDADYMGLSQLYQLRGRVGRANRQAYAYLMYKRDKVLQETAEKRLQTIRDFTEFGSGFRIAMRDMEIRGAGNLLGGEQHGHMDAVGYDMYCRLLEEVIKEKRNEKTETPFETTIDINLSAYIPGYFIPNEEQKLDIYKKVSLIRNQQDYFDVQEEIEDRFGNLPASVQNLLEVSLLKAAAHNLDIAAITHKGDTIKLVFRPDAKVDPNKIMAVVTANKQKLVFTAGLAPALLYHIEGDRLDVWDIKELLEKML